MPSKDYKYDVFISYRRTDPVRGWVQNHFYPVFEQWFKESIPHSRKQEPSVFIDLKLETGTKWADELREALQHSRCIVCVWSPHYFRQPWCLAEWLSMVEREKRIQKQLDSKQRLVYPVKFNDGDSFPEDAKASQYIDLSKYNIPEPYYKKTRPYVAFHKQMQVVAESVAKMVMTAPVWEENWPLVDADSALEKLQPVHIPLKRL